MTEEAFNMLGNVNMEIYYWWSIALMFAIHAGFLSLEVGVSRVKNVLASSVKNFMALAIVIPTFYLVGWWIYNAFPDGFIPRFDEASLAALPWSENMGPNVADNATGVFWGAFALFSATTASILSGTVIERIRLSAFVILAGILGSVIWILGGAWGWHPEGWLLTELGYHDVGASGVVHTIAGFFALGVLFNLGSRIGKYKKDGTPNPILPHNLPSAFLGMMLIFVGFFGFLAGCLIFIVGGQWETIYGTPATLSSFAFNGLMGFSGGIIGAYLSSKGEPFWTISGGLAGFISVGAGLDLYYPGLALVIGAIGGFVAYLLGSLLERKGVDDPVGAISVHGFIGFWGVLAVGIFASGYPNVAGPEISLFGQALGAIVMAALGFIPGYGISFIMKKLNALRIPPEVEIVGLDVSEIPASAFPEGIPATAGKITPILEKKKVSGEE
ncbi:ammonium transporter [Aquibacillus albus]|uniref:Ammonia channel protein AmtB n=1 Tax=Aquibacillus albus TaxID=1168171 RepID=A0ABS2MWF6_9BACI|nr:ammonium transporter [Aquibacillus albus]MBM7570181.1 ammonia channel protein AmtB [Aquibacillus albus]